MKRKSKTTTRHPEQIVELRLYVAGQTPKSLAAISNLKKICNDRFDAQFRVEVIDLAKNPVLARDHQILAIPTLVRSLPVPIRKIIGDLSDTERVVVCLEVRNSKTQTKAVKDETRARSSASRPKT